MTALQKIKGALRQEDWDIMKKLAEGVSPEVEALFAPERIEQGKKYMAEHQTGLNTYRERYKDDGSGTAGDKKPEEKKE